jgi:hypothetical protein
MTDTINLEPVYREFVLKNSGIWYVIVEFVKANAARYMHADKPLHIIVFDGEQKRHNLQNRYYWKAVIEQIADQAWVDGKQFSKDTWHEYFARKHCPMIEFVLPDGEIIQRRKSTSEMTVKEFSEYTTTVQAESANEFGVRFLERVA